MYTVPLTTQNSNVNLCVQIDPVLREKISDIHRMTNDARIGLLTTQYCWNKAIYLRNANNGGKRYKTDLKVNEHPN